MFRLALIETQNIKSIIPLLHLLNEGMQESLMEQRLEDMTANNYKCLGVYDGEKLIAICGIWTLHKIYVGKHLELDNVVVLPAYRSQGVGEQMIAWVEHYALTHNCEAIELNAYVNNTKGIAFWKRNGYNILGHHFQKKI